VVIVKDAVVLVPKVVFRLHHIPVGVRDRFAVGPLKIGGVRRE
jgi:hypothetical protein